MMNDKLHALFNLQKISQKRLYGVTLPRLSPERIPMQTTAIVAELGEVLKECESWKDWKKQPRLILRNKLLEEIADLWHFIINLTLYLGFDADDIYQAFLEKNHKNQKRQDDGY